MIQIEKRVYEILILQFLEHPSQYHICLLIVFDEIREFRAQV